MHPTASGERPPLTWIVAALVPGTGQMPTRPSLGVGSIPRAAMVTSLVLLARRRSSSVTPRSAIEGCTPGRP